VSLSPEKLQNLLEYTVRKINIAPIMGTCNVDHTLNSEDAVNTIMELFIKRHEGFVLEGGPPHLFVGIHNIHDNVYRVRREVGAVPKKHNRDVLR
jgi:hypothetical protein